MQSTTSYSIAGNTEQHESEVQQLDVVQTDNFRRMYDLGFNLIPADDKVTVKRWKQYQTERLEPELFESWLEQFSGHNFALLTGQCPYDPAIGIVVVDADDEAALNLAVSRVPTTPVKQYSARGEHFIYRHPGFHVPTVRGLVVNNQKYKLDVKGDGGYIMSPGSMHKSGIRYREGCEWTRHLISTAPIFNPEWLDIQPKAESKETDWSFVDHDDNGETFMPEKVKFAKAWLERQPVCQQGHGASSYFLALTGKVLHGFSLDEGSAIDVLEEWGKRSIDEYGSSYPWNYHEVKHKVRDAAKQKPEQAPGWLLRETEKRELHDLGERATEITSDLTDTGHDVLPVDTFPLEVQPVVDPEPTPTTVVPATAEGPQPEIPGDGWGQPLPLERHDSPAFPLDALDVCPLFKEQCETVARYLQVPGDAPACLGLAVIAAAIQSKVRVEIRHNLFAETVLWTICGLRPGERKTATVERMRRPIELWEADARAAAEPDLNFKRGERRAAKEKLKSAEKSLATCNAGTPEYEQVATDFGRLERLLEQPEPASPRLLVSDATPEVLAVILAQNQCVACIHDEGTLLDIVMGRYSRTPNLGLLLRAFDGKGEPVDRIGRESLQIDKAFVSLGLLVQPDVLTAVLCNDASTARGFAQRFLACLPKSKLGEREIIMGAFPEATQAAWDALIVKLLSDSRPRELTHTLESWDLVRQWERELEAALGAGRQLEHYAEWTSKAFPGQLMRLAAALHMASDAAANVIPTGTLKAAKTILDYFLAQQKVLAGVQSRAEEIDLDVAQAMLRRLKERKKMVLFNSDFTASSRQLRREPKSEEIVQRACEILQAAGIIKPKKATPKGVIKSWDVNPHLLD